MPRERSYENEQNCNQHRALFQSRPSGPISDSDHEKIGERPEQFENLLGEVDPHEKRKVLLKLISDARDHLSKYPASCAARERREKAFSELYQLNRDNFSMTVEETDKAYRKKEDYVFAKLVYEKSRTCCWNSSNAKMFDIIMDLVDSQEDAAASCSPPPVFMVEDDGYAPYEAQAKKLGQESYWMAWSADETCPQKNVTDDTEAEHEWTSYCDLDLFGKAYDGVTDSGGSSAGGS